MSLGRQLYMIGRGSRHVGDESECDMLFFASLVQQRPRSWREAEACIQQELFYIFRMSLKSEKGRNLAACEAGY